MIKKIALPTTVLAGAVIIWHIIASLGIFLPSLLPTPVAVVQGIVELFLEGVLLTHIGTSLMRVLIGFLLAAIIAVPLGLLLGTYKQLHIAFNPLLQILRPISPIAWIPLAILWFGIGDKPAVFIIFITSFFPILVAAAGAVKQVDPLLVKSAINLGATKRQLMRKVIFPSTFPAIVIGLRISLGIAWVIIVAAEMVGMRSGLGYMILDARNFMRTDLIIGGMIIVGLIGLSLDSVMQYIQIKVKKKWQGT